MKKCNTQIMKEIKTLEEYRAKWISVERVNCTVSYLQGEEPVLPDYDYETTRANIDYLDKEIRRLKGLLAYSNVTTIVEGFDMNINEALIYLAQLKQKESHYNFLMSKNKISRSTSGFGNANIEFTKILYDQDVVREELKEVTDTIMMLQMAIDRTNLTNMIEC